MKKRKKDNFFVRSMNNSKVNRNKDHSLSTIIDLMSSGIKLKKTIPKRQSQIIKRGNKIKND